MASEPEARCQICDWPIKKTIQEGCVPGNCSFRPAEGSPEYYRIQERRRQLEMDKLPRKSAVASEQPTAAAGSAPQDTGLLYGRCYKWLDGKSTENVGVYMFRPSDLVAFVLQEIARAQAPQRCDRPMHTYIWKCGDFLAVAQATDQFEARNILLQEFEDEGAPKDFRDRASEKSPEIFHRQIAQFVRTDSHELQQADAEVESLKKQLAEARAALQGEPGGEKCR